jgi:hypothetical protein
MQTRAKTAAPPPLVVPYEELILLGGDTALWASARDRELVEILLLLHKLNRL